LVDQSVVEKISQAAELNSDDMVLEIGPGLGILTQELVERAGKVVAVELDEKLLAYLQSRFSGVKNLVLVSGDILQLLPVELLPWLAQPYKVVANLPYQITAVLLRRLLTLKNKPKLLVLMVQAEVAERVCARPGAMSVLAVMAQYYSQPQIVLTVSKDQFWPIPQVNSAVLKLKPKSKFSLPSALENSFFKLVKVGFASRRKMLKNNLINVYTPQKVEAALKQTGLKGQMRAQELTVSDWLNLFGALLG